MISNKAHEFLNKWDAFCQRYEAEFGVSIGTRISESSYGIYTYAIMYTEIDRDDVLEHFSRINNILRDVGISPGDMMSLPVAHVSGGYRSVFRKEMSIWLKLMDL